MYELFSKLLNLSFSAALLVLLVVVLRLIFKKAPRALICLMWALVGVRLLLPVSIPTPFSAYHLLDNSSISSGQVEYFHYTGHSEKPTVEFPTVQIEREPETDSAPHPVITTKTSDVYLPPVISFWLIGVCAMLAYAISSTLSLRQSVRASVPIEKNVRICDGLHSPFILGIFRPCIYLPSDLDETAATYVMAHEIAHLRRGDHLWKPLGFLLLSIHWFNPALWLAYYLLCRDIEIACDEKVISAMPSDGKRAYSEVLLACSTPNRARIACPLAFGEVGTKARIRSVLNYKKPAFWLVLAALLVCIVLALCFLTDPSAVPAEVPQIDTPQKTTYVSEACIYINPLSSFFPVSGDSGCIYTVTPTEFQISRRSDESTQSIPVEQWQWQPFPWSKEEWAELVMHSDPLENQELAAIYYQPLNEEHFLLRVDDALWLVDWAKDHRLIWDIYSLVAQESKGSAKWEFHPESSAGYPAFRFALNIPNQDIHATCVDGGTLIAFDHPTASGYPQGVELIVPAGEALYWSPMNQDGTICTQSIIHISAAQGNNTFDHYGTIYITSDGMTYEATIVGTELTLLQEHPASIHLGHAVLAPESVDEYAYNESGTIRMVKVDGTLYLDTGAESTISARCGTMEGYITSEVAPSEIPMEDNQSNFGTDIGYQMFSKDTIEVFVDRKFIVFKAAPTE